MGNLRSGEGGHGSPKRRVAGNSVISGDRIGERKYRPPTAGVVDLGGVRREEEEALGTMVSESHRSHF